MHAYHSISLSLSLKFYNYIQMTTMAKFIDHEVEDIISVTKTPKGMEYEIKWKGCTQRDWVAEEDLNCPELVKKFMSSLSKVT